MTAVMGEALVVDQQAIAGATLPPTPVQYPQLGIRRIEDDHDIVAVQAEDFPWIHQDRAVNVCRIEYIGGQAVRFGSIVGAHKGLSRWADRVNPIDSENVQRSLLSNLPVWLEGRDTGIIRPVAGHIAKQGLFKVAGRRGNPPRLFFACIHADAPTILKVAISTHNDQPRVANIITNHACGSRLPQHYRG